MAEEIKILLLEDMPSDAEFVKRVLTRTNHTFVYERVSTQDDFLNALHNFLPDIILADHTLPQFDSMSALRIVREQYPWIPFVLVTGTVSEEFAVQAIKQGADDYILKRSLTRLPAAIEAALERRRTEKALRQSEEKVQMTIKLLNDMKFALDQANIVAITDSEGILTYVNEKFCQISGYSVDELIGKTHRIVDSGHHTREFFQELWATIKQGKVWRNEIKNRARDGREYWLDTTIVPFLDEEDQPYQFVAINRDITDRKAMEESLLRANRELKQVNEELDRFVYSASHDLKAPLIAVLGLVNLIKEDVRNQQHLEYLDLIEQSLGNLRRVITSLTNFSRNARLEIEHKPIDFHALLQQCIESLNYLDKEQRIDFRVQIEGSDTFISDPLRLSILLNNLISNAVIYHDSRQEKPFVKIHICITPEKALISITDNGHGIEEKHQKRVFDMFFRGSEQSVGSGLGLYIVKGIVDRLQGSIHLESEVGKGSVFTIELPNFNTNLSS